MNTQNMNDQEMMNDALSTQKYVTSNYNNFAGECANLQLRDDMLCILQEEHMIQSDIFGEMQKRGWYNTSPAEQQKINQAKTKFPPQ